MTHLAIKLVDYFAKSTHIEYNQDDLDVYYYGMECFLNFSSVTFIIAIWSILTNCFIETILFLICFSIIRHHTGGFHAKTNKTCIILSSLTGFSVYFAIKYQDYILHNKTIIFIASFIIILLFAPNDSKKIDLSHNEKLHEKILSIITIVTLYIISTYSPTEYDTAIIYSIFASTFLLLTSKVTHYISHLHTI